MFRGILAVILAFSTCISAQTVTTVCNTGELPDDADPATALSYLRQDRQNLTTACIVNAIQTIGLAKYEPAIPTLVQYLNFKVPPSRVIRHTQGPTTGLYPAADNLARFAETAIPALKSTLADSEESLTSRVNAAKVLFAVSNNKQEVVRAIIKASQNSQDQDAVNALKKLAEQTIAYCASTNQQCKDALKDQ